jgi:Na+-driven multidrug efflux pump
LKPFIAIGVKVMLIVLAAVLALEVRMIMAGQLGDSEVAATAVLINIQYSIIMISQGIQLTIIAVFGNLLGENEPELAWRMFKVNMMPWTSIFAFISILMIAFRGPITTLFSGESEAKNIEEEAMVISAIFAFL